MKGDNPPRQRTRLGSSQSSQAQLDYEAEAELYHFPPTLERNSAHVPSISARPRSRAAQQTMNASEDDLWDFPPIKIGNQAPLFSCSLPFSNKEEPSQLRRRQQPNIGLGGANIVNMADGVMPVKVRLYILYADYEWCSFSPGHISVKAKIGNPRCC